MHKLMNMYPEQKEFIIKTHIIIQSAFWWLVALVAATLVIYQILFISSYIGLTNYQQYQQEQQLKEQQKATQQLQQQESAPDSE